MNLTQNPELLDRLAAAYSLGTLRGGARRRFEQLAREYPQVRAAILLWQGRWSAFTEVQTPIQPDSVVWTRIENLLQSEKANARREPQRDASSVQTALERTLRWWRGLSLISSIAAATTIAVALWLTDAAKQQQSDLQSQLQTAQAALQASPQIQYVAVLADGKATASLLVTFDPKLKQLVLQRVSSYQVADTRSLQLWALPQQGAPRSLGVIGEGRLEQISAQEDEIQTIPTLAVSLEPKGGVPSHVGPTGPVLFKGALIKREL